MPIRMQFRRGTAAQWTAANPVLFSGELGLETDTNKFKIGNGTTAWNSLSYGGLIGPSGPIGPTGPQGATGPQGTTGPTGLQGTTGATGPQGNVGETGATGPKGDIGNIGATGATGTQGATGPAGYVGSDGSTGATGPTGAGTTGATGATGPAGSNGSIGATGPTGPAGSAGTNGSTGATGPADLTVNEVSGTSQTLSSSNWNQYFYFTNSGFNAITLPASTATSNAGKFWSLKNATASTLSITITNTLSLTNPLIIAPGNIVSLVISGTAANTILLF